MKRFAVAFAVMLAGCARTPEEDRHSAQFVLEDMVFVKHANGLCFAVAYPRTQWTVYTNIPCISGDTVFVK